MIGEDVKINTNEQLDYLINYLADERNENIEIPADFESKRMLFRSLMNIRPPHKISKDFLKVQDEFLTQETLNKNLTCPQDITERKGKIRLWQGDITTLKVDAIVNAANSKLLGCFIPGHNCIDNVIHSSAGLQLREECNIIMKIQAKDEEVGKAKITGAYNLPSKYVIHTVGPQIPHGTKPSGEACDALAGCYKSCLEIAEYNKLKSIAFCCISTGVFNFPQDMAAEIAVRTVENYFKNRKTDIDDVIFNVFTDKDYMIYKKELF